MSAIKHKGVTLHFFVFARLFEDSNL